MGISLGIGTECIKLGIKKLNPAMCHRSEGRYAEFTVNYRTRRSCTARNVSRPCTVDSSVKALSTT